MLIAPVLHILLNLAWTIFLVVSNLETLGQFYQTSIQGFERLALNSEGYLIGPCVISAQWFIDVDVVCGVNLASLPDPAWADWSVPVERKRHPHTLETTPPTASRFPAATPPAPSATAPDESQVPLPVPGLGPVLLPSLLPTIVIEPSASRGIPPPTTTQNKESTKETKFNAKKLAIWSIAVLMLVIPLEYMRSRDKVHAATLAAALAEIGELRQLVVIQPLGNAGQAAIAEAFGRVHPPLFALMLPVRTPSPPPPPPPPPRNLGTLRVVPSNTPIPTPPPPATFALRSPIHSPMVRSPPSPSRRAAAPTASAPTSLSPDTTVHENPAPPPALPSSSPPATVHNQAVPSLTPTHRAVPCPQPAPVPASALSTTCSTNPTPMLRTMASVTSLPGRPFHPGVTEAAVDELRPITSSVSLRGTALSESAASPGDMSLSELGLFPTPEAQTQVDEQTHTEQQLLLRTMGEKELARYGQRDSDGKLKRLPEELNDIQEWERKNCFLQHSAVHKPSVGVRGSRGLGAEESVVEEEEGVPLEVAEAVVGDIAERAAADVIHGVRVKNRLVPDAQAQEQAAEDGPAALVAPVQPRQREVEGVSNEPSVALTDRDHIRAKAQADLDTWGRRNEETGTLAPLLDERRATYGWAAQQITLARSVAQRPRLPLRALSPIPQPISIIQYVDEATTTQP
ncbi:hypothetical protein C8R43DRAFT_1122630 [Mycena crocata]|nr:hypothetical protein C8R43DRAFT_1122630 [Mycena crocata]